MKHTNDSINALVSISGTMASIGLALVGILSAKSSMTKTGTISDDLFLFASLGFLIVLTVGYFAQKASQHPQFDKLLTLAEIIFALSMITILFGGFVLIYTEL